MQVLKFGGTSVANAENINKVVAIVQEAIQKDRTACSCFRVGRYYGCIVGSRCIGIGRK